LSTLLLNIRPWDARQFTCAQQILQLEGLAVAIPWGFESPLPHQKPETPDFTGVFILRLIVDPDLIPLTLIHRAESDRFTAAIRNRDPET